MTVQDIRALVCEVLAQVQKDNGAEPTQVTDEMVPLKDFAGIDSLSCLDATVRLSERLGIELDDSLFHDKRTNRDRSLSEVCEELRRRTAARVTVAAP